MGKCNWSTYQATLQISPGNSITCYCPRLLKRNPSSTLGVTTGKELCFGETGLNNLHEVFGNKSIYNCYVFVTLRTFSLLLLLVPSKLIKLEACKLKQKGNTPVFKLRPSKVILFISTSAWHLCARVLY